MSQRQMISNGKTLRYATARADGKAVTTSPRHWRRNGRGSRSVIGQPGCT
jgi:hypothetical protein